ncbi:MAG: protein rep [Actinomycetota bacterium]
MTTTTAQRPTSHQTTNADTSTPSRMGSAAGVGRGGEGGGALSVTTAVDSSPPGGRELRRAMDRVQSMIRETCGHIPEAQRLVHCGRTPTGVGVPQVRRSESHAYVSGLQTCGSVWSCPSCSFKIRMRRAAEISTAVARHIEAGGGVLHVVITMPHRAGEDLDGLWSMLSDCWAYTTGGGAWENFKTRHGLIGYIRAAEVTHSWRSGWHPHLHVLVLVDKPVSPVQNEEAYYQLRRAIRERWCKRMAARYERTMSEEFGIRVDPVKADEASGSGAYVTKVGLELAAVHTKVGRTAEHRTPFAIAHDAMANGDVDDLRLFQEWLQASWRKRSISWSQGLRELLDIGPEATDDEIASEDQGGEIVASIDPDLWRLLVKRRDGARADFVAVFNDHTRDRTAIAYALALLRDLGLPAVVDDTGRHPTIGLDHPSNHQGETIQ